MTDGTFKVRLVRIRIKDDWQPNITMHALLRYIERVEGVDVDAIKAKMTTQGLRRAIAMGAGSVKVGGYRFIIQGRKVVTVLTPDMRPKKDTKRQDKQVNERAQNTAGTQKLTRKQREILEGLH